MMDFLRFYRARRWEKKLPFTRFLGYPLLGMAVGPEGAFPSFPFLLYLVDGLAVSGILAFSYSLNDYFDFLREGDSNYMGRYLRAGRLTRRSASLLIPLPLLLLPSLLLPLPTLLLLLLLLFLSLLYSLPQVGIGRRRRVKFLLPPFSALLLVLQALLLSSSPPPSCLGLLLVVFHCHVNSFHHLEESGGRGEGTSAFSPPLPPPLPLPPARYLFPPEVERGEGRGLLFPQIQAFRFSSLLGGACWICPAGDDGGALTHGRGGDCGRGAGGAHGGQNPGREGDFPAGVGEEQGLRPEGVFRGNEGGEVRIPHPAPPGSRDGGGRVRGGGAGLLEEGLPHTLCEAPLPAEVDWGTFTPFPDQQEENGELSGQEGLDLWSGDLPGQGAQEDGEGGEGA